jgi:hypothetical protein
VRIRTRKPWRFARRRLFGWKVRLPLVIVGSGGSGIATRPQRSRRLSIRTGRSRWPAALTTERVSRRPLSCAVWKIAVLSSRPPSPRAIEPRPPGRRDAPSEVFSTVVERDCG